MSTFTCYLYGKSETSPDKFFVVASSLEHARELVRDELLKRGGVSVEIWEGETVLCRETAEPS